MSDWTGVNGKHWGLITDRCALLIERSVIPETLNLLATQRTVEGILDTLTSRGIEQLPGFCLVGFDDSRVTAYLRGGFSLRVEASWHDALTESGKQVRTWREVSVDGVSRFAIIGPEEWHHADLPIRSYASERERILHGVQGLSLAVCEQLTTGEIPLMTTTSAAGRPSTTRPENREQVNTTSNRVFDELFGPSPLPSTPEEDAVAAPPNEDHTILVGRPSQEPQHGEAEADAEDTNPTDRDNCPALILPGGDTVPVTGKLLLGRNPRQSGDTDAELVAVFDPNGNISRTHASITPTGDGVVLEDLDSTNGTVLVTAADEILLLPRTPRIMRHGDRIILGGDAQLEFRESQ